MTANSRLTRMLSFRTFFEASASRFALRIASVWRFMRSMARRMYAALERCSVSAQRRLISNTSSGSFNEMAPMILLINILTVYVIIISKKRVRTQGFRSFHHHADMAV